MISIVFERSIAGERSTDVMFASEFNDIFRLRKFKKLLRNTNDMYNDLFDELFGN